jgi:hypothetical protein
MKIKNAAPAGVHRMSVRMQNALCACGMGCAHLEPRNALRALPDLPVAEVCQPLHVCFAFARVKRIQRHLGGGFGTGLA